jgi:3-phosphoshikimate 1-carboxyvinyltransferase
VEVTRIKPLRAPPDVTLSPPGSKSITNRALLCASLADGTSTLSGALFAQDTQAMMDAVAALGAGLRTRGEAIPPTGWALVESVDIAA